MNVTEATRRHPGNSSAWYAGYIAGFRRTGHVNVQPDGWSVPDYLRGYAQGYEDAFAESNIRTLV